MSSSEAVVIHEPRTGGALSVANTVKAIDEMRHFIAAAFKPTLDFGTIPGAGTKKVLLLPGAQKTAMYFNTSPTYHIEKTEMDGGHVEYLVTCRLVSRGTGEIVAEGIGSCSTMESKYRFRSAERVCPECGKPAIIKGKAEYGGGYVCFKKKDGCGFKFADDDPAITDQAAGQTDNKNIHDLRNTVLKMAKKRCLGGNTPLLVKGPRGLVRSDVEGLWQMIQRQAPESVFQLPGSNGDWRNVQGMVRQDHPFVMRIDIRDGSYIHASQDHVFPTSSGMMSVDKLSIGDSFVRSRIPIEESGDALHEYGWLAGFFLAEGHVRNSSGSVQFAIHQDEIGFAEKIISIAKPLGSRCVFTNRKQGKAADVAVYGMAFRGLVEQFIDGKDCYSKHISKHAWREGVPFLESLLGGYLDGDGHYCQRESGNPYWIVGFTGHNRDLAYDLRCLVPLVGKRFRLGRGESTCQGKTFPTFEGWIKEDFDSSYNLKDMASITAITKENRKAVLYDIEVDGDHVFCLANGIQTHNSYVDAAVSLGCLSELFTQDMEKDESHGEERHEKPPQEQPKRPAQKPPMTFYAILQWIGNKKYVKDLQEAIPRWQARKDFTPQQIAVLDGACDARIAELLAEAAPPATRMTKDEAKANFARIINELPADGLGESWEPFANEISQTCGHMSQELRQEIGEYAEAIWNARKNPNEAPW